jgi:hypothetical protein
MTSTQICEIVREYLARSVEKFRTRDSSIDLVLGAVNDAKTYLQQVRNWQHLQHTQMVTIPTTGLDITLSINGSFKRIDYIYKVESGVVGERLQYITHKGAYDIFKDISEHYGDVYRVGSKIFVAGASIPVDVLLVGYQWLPLYDNATVTSDFFTEYGSNYLKLYAINQLQLFQKEDTRSYISKDRVQDAYRALITFDGEISLTKDQQLLE